MGDAAELAMEAEMKYPDMDPVDAIEQHIDDLVKEHDNVAETTVKFKMVSVPVWCYGSSVPDPEVTVVLCEEMIPWIYDVDIEDSRTAQKILIEAALLFCEKHASDDQDYWTERDFLEDIEIFAQQLRKVIVKAGPKWYNDEHHTMYGKSHLKDVWKENT